MATEERYATSHLAGNFSNPANAVLAPDGTYTTDTSNASPTSRWAMGDPSAGITGLQAITVTCRKNASGGNGDPTLAINLYELGTLVTAVKPATAVTDATTTLQGNFDASVITNPADVEIELVVSGVGGSPSGRRTVQVDAIDWTVNLAGAPPKQATGSSSIVLTSTGTPARTAKGTGTSALSVTGGVGSTQRTAKATGSSSLTVTSTGQGSAGVKTATGSSSLSISSSATPQRIAKGVGSSSLAVSSSATPQRTAKATGASSLVVTGLATPARTAKGSGTSSLVLTTSGSSQRTAKAQGSSALVLTSSGQGSKPGGEPAAPVHQLQVGMTGIW